MNDILQEERRQKELNVVKTAFYDIAPLTLLVAPIIEPTYAVSLHTYRPALANIPLILANKDKQLQLFAHDTTLVDSWYSQSTHIHSVVTWHTDDAHSDVVCTLCSNGVLTFTQYEPAHPSRWTLLNQLVVSSRPGIDTHNFTRVLLNDVASCLLVTAFDRHIKLISLRRTVNAVDIVTQIDGVVDGNIIDSVFIQTQNAQFVRVILCVANEAETNNDQSTNSDAVPTHCGYQIRFVLLEFEMSSGRWRTVSLSLNDSATPLPGLVYALPQQIIALDSTSPQTSLIVVYAMMLVYCRLVDNQMQTVQVIPIPAGANINASPTPLFTCHAVAGSRLLLLNDHGDLYALTYRASSYASPCAIMYVGQTCPSDTMTYYTADGQNGLDEFIVVGGSGCDGMTIRLEWNSQDPASTAQLWRQYTWTNLAPIIDVTTHDDTIYALTGLGDHSKLRTFQHGVTFDTQSSSSMDYAALHSLIPLYTDSSSRHPSYLLCSFLTSTRLLAVTSDDDLDDVTATTSILTDVCTLAAQCVTINNVLMFIQITSRRVRLISQRNITKTFTQIETEWSPTSTDVDSRLSDADVFDNVMALVLMPKRLLVIARIEVNYSMTFVSHLPLTDDCSVITLLSPHVVAVGTHSSQLLLYRIDEDSVTLTSAVSLLSFMPPQVDLAIPHSVHLLTHDTIIIGVRDGTIIRARLTANGLSDTCVRRVGVVPVQLTPFRRQPLAAHTLLPITSSSCWSTVFDSALLALSDRLHIIYVAASTTAVSDQSVCIVPLCVDSLSSISHAAAFTSANATMRLCLVADESMHIGSMTPSHLTRLSSFPPRHISERSFPLDDTPHRIVIVPAIPAAVILYKHRPLITVCSLGGQPICEWSQWQKQEFPQVISLWRDDVILVGTSIRDQDVRAGRLLILHVATTNARTHLLLLSEVRLPSAVTAVIAISERYIIAAASLHIYVFRIERDPLGSRVQQINVDVEFAMKHQILAIAAVDDTETDLLSHGLVKRLFVSSSKDGISLLHLKQSSESELRLQIVRVDCDARQCHEISAFQYRSNIVSDTKTQTLNPTTSPTSLLPPSSLNITRALCVDDYGVLSLLRDEYPLLVPPASNTDLKYSTMRDTLYRECTFPFKTTISRIAPRQAQRRRDIPSDPTKDQSPSFLIATNIGSLMTAIVITDNDAATFTLLQSRLLLFLNAHSTRQWNGDEWNSIKQTLYAPLSKQIINADVLSWWNCFNRQERAEIIRGWDDMTTERIDQLLDLWTRKIV